ncbi:MAG: F0F1 ATP synthase subunit epsilon [Acidimicrobiia bacterium]
MKAEVVSPERILFEGDAEMVVCRTSNGDAAFLEGHEPFLGMLAPGEIRVINDGKEFAFKCTRGFVEVDGSHVRVISDDAQPL